jgi:tRNA (adenine57-N1/adenine58-N1)-methyltransferase
MSFKNYDAVSKEGDLVQLTGSGHKSHFVRLKSDGLLQTHKGEIQHKDMIGKPWGLKLISHTGHPFFLMRPGLANLITEIKRNTQIIYPKDIGYIIVMMGVGPGTHVLEAGTGSGALTTAFAFFVGDEGKVTSYDNREQMQNLARKNLERVDLLSRVDLKMGDANEGFVERDVDAVFLDLTNPYDFIPQVKASLKLGGFFGTILPTTNQVSRLLVALQSNSFSYIEVCELMLRFYKPEWDRLRPTDRMVAHTGYLVFARSIFERPVED